MRRLIYAFAIFAGLLSETAGAFIELQGLEPNPAQAGETVNLLIRMGECDALADFPVVTADNENIDILIDGSRRFDPIFCTFSIIDHVLPISAFSQGTYTVTVRYRFTPLFGPTQIETIDVLQLVVEQTPPAMPIPVGSRFWTLLLILLVLAMGMAVMRRRALLGIFVLLLVPAYIPDVAAQLTEDRIRLHVLLANDPNVPTPQAIIENWTFGDPAPLSSLAVGTPVAAWYLLPFRAEGEFKARLEADPDSPRARLERWIVIEYPSSADKESALSALRIDPRIEAVTEPMFFSPSSGTPGGGTANYGWSSMNVGSVWQFAGGHALIGVVDTGLATQHSELRAFTSAGAFTKGNFLASLSADVGRWPAGVDTDVDERKLQLVAGPQVCNTDPDGMGRVEDTIGHGTHVAGLIGANAYDSNNVAGVCKHCGISMWRYAFAQCFPGEGIRPEFNSEAIAVSVTALGDLGAQVINLSLGSPSDPCSASNPMSMCDALAYLSARDVVSVASSGNARIRLNFPAKDGRVVAAGGFDEQLLLWDDIRESNNTDDCPYPPSFRECGSNYTSPGSQPKQEVVGAARQVFGVMYPGFNWVEEIGCGDSFGSGAIDDGYGICTGTSMSAPQISGLFGILRSVNPLVPVGNPENSGVTGVRDVLTSTTFQAQAGQPWERRLGYGRPDAAAAVRKMLGTVAGETVRNRVTPLFGLYNSVTGDHAFTTSPQLAMGLIGNQKHSYAPVGDTIPGYSEFPDPMLQGHEPLASTFVLTTEYKVDPRHPDLVPLYLFSFSRPDPVAGAAGCTPGQPGCVTKPEGFVMVTTVAEVEWLHDEGLHYWGVEGYVYEPCDHIQNPGCVPQDAEPLYRQCKNKSMNPDCAIFLESERNAFEAQGYQFPFPANFPMHIGYAYPNVDTDGDTLIDGFEYLIGTDPTLVDTDGDGSNDGVEFPMASVALSDPCDGPMSHRCRINRIFANRFEDGPYTGPGAGSPGPLNVPEACAQVDGQLTEYENRLAERESELEEGGGPAWQEHMEEVAAVEEVRDSLSEYCDW